MSLAAILPPREMLHIRPFSPRSFFFGSLGDTPRSQKYRVIVVQPTCGDQHEGMVSISGPVLRYDNSEN